MLSTTEAVPLFRSWGAFVRGRVIAGDPDAKLVASLGGASPSAIRTLLRAQLKDGRIDDESYCIRLDALDMVQMRYKNHDAIPERDSRDWVPIHGGFLRAEHRNSEGSTDG